MFRHNRGVSRSKTKDGYEANRVSDREFPKRDPSRPEVHTKDVELAEVVDVIRSEDHPDFEENRDIGKVKIRRLMSEFNRGEDALQYARPANDRLRSYPLEHELVATMDLHGITYYFGTMNVRNNVHQNSAPLSSVGKRGSEADTRERYQEAFDGLQRSPEGGDVDIEGEEFEVDTSVKPLRHKVGDVVHEGRFGNSIRLGRDDNQNPVIKIRVGQREELQDTNFLEPFFESINDDPTSIWITEDTEVDFEAATESLDQHLFSAQNPSRTFDGSQIFFDADRIILNAKEQEIFAFSSDSVNIVSGEDFTVDAKNEIRIATDNNNEPMVRGQQLVDRLRELLNTLQQETHPTPVGPTGPPNQAPVYQTILQDILSTIRSDKSFVDNL